MAISYIHAIAILVYPILFTHGNSACGRAGVGAGSDVACRHGELDEEDLAPGDGGVGAGGPGGGGVAGGGGGEAGAGELNLVARHAAAVVGEVAGHSGGLAGRDLGWGNGLCGFYYFIA